MRGKKHKCLNIADLRHSNGKKFVIADWFYSLDFRTQRDVLDQHPRIVSFVQTILRKAKNVQRKNRRDVELWLYLRDGKIVRHIYEQHEMLSADTVAGLVHLHFENLLRYAVHIAKRSKKQRLKDMYEQLIAYQAAM